MEFIPTSIHDEYGYNRLLHRYHKLRGTFPRPTYISYSELFSQYSNQSNIYTSITTSDSVPTTTTTRDNDKQVLSNIINNLSEHEKEQISKAGVIGEGTYAKIHRYVSI